MAEYGTSFLPTVGWTLNNASIVDDVMSIQAGGSASITLTEIAGSNLLSETLLLRVISDVYTDRYAPTTWAEISILFIDNQTLTTRIPIVDLLDGVCAAIMYTTIATYDASDVSAMQSITIKFMSSVAVNFSTWTLSKEEGGGTAVEQGVLYHGIKITATYGFEAIRSDNAARAYFNSDTLAMQVSADEGETWVNKIWFDPVTGTYIFDGTLSADVVNALAAVITPMVVADMGNIKELTVGMLSTAWKPQRYLNNDTPTLDYIRVHDKYIDFIRATTEGTDTEQAVTIDNQLAYWIDEEHTAATTDVTDWPVMQFVYDELIKLSLNFTEGDVDGVPTIALGAGVGDGTRNGRGFIYKSDGGLYIEYVTYGGESRILKLTESGIDFSQWATMTFNTETVFVGVPRVWVDVDIPQNAQVDDIFIDKDDYTRYDALFLTTGATLLVSDDEVIYASGTFTITLHEAIQKVVVKYIFNIGTGIVHIAGTINGNVDGINLFPGDSIRLFTDGTIWRY